MLTLVSLVNSQRGLLEQEHGAPRLGHPAPHEVSPKLHDRQQEGDVGIERRVETAWSGSLVRKKIHFFSLLSTMVNIGGVF